MRKIAIGSITLLLVVAIGLYALDLLIDHASWKQVSAADSPDGTYTVFEYQYFSDGDRHAPYGTYIFIKPASSNKKAINSHVIFAGYCRNDHLYNWVSHKEIAITCIASEKEGVKTIAKKAYGISIHTVIEQQQIEKNQAVVRSRVNRKKNFHGIKNDKR